VQGFFQRTGNKSVSPGISPRKSSDTNKNFNFTDRQIFQLESLPASLRPTIESECLSLLDAFFLYALMDVFSFNF
jgi:hypothetical protein